MKTFLKIPALYLGLVLFSSTAYIVAEEPAPVAAPNQIYDEVMGTLPPADDILQLNGTIESVDPSTLEIKIKSADSSNVIKSFRVGDDTLIHKNGEELLIKELTPGSSVKISYTHSMPGFKGPFALQIFVM